MARIMYIKLTPLIDLLECLQDANKDNITIVSTIDEVIEIAYKLAEAK